MSRKDQLARLRQLAGLILDLRLSQLHGAAQARAQSQARLAGLEVSEVCDLPPIAAAQAALRYQGWADARRAEINIQLARQTADWLEAQATARRAFGQSQALESVQQRLRP